MSLVKAVVIAFCAWCLLEAVERVCKTVDGAIKVMHENCIVGDGKPPVYLNDPARKPFSFRKK